MQGHWFFLLGATLRTRTFCRLVFDENDKVVLYHDVWSVQDTIHGMLLGWTRLPGSTESMSLWVHERVVKPVMTMIVLGSLWLFGKYNSCRQIHMHS
ncbi:hypothetical protein SAICODRAFT_30688 [Saitoella complicata NRRL Y-17804]|uniref:uncharacterized protein n=1 Tax=Saitoella complicata (strain BCRC 22490 / CBS 7301 / JCM 7358 / NBRC 10748 / NRRL Y-17804) TaxID=698492 RepID=UPI0008677C53|nr:uncharacterized protein SAICODRAFT_30688 [Saitoella complicata NRRL Y-17804]ODQ52572.1 hypothetical protein SAICODRAFT_30688 [Saitoella complicata NRRL Y-17804]